MYKGYLIDLDGVAYSGKKVIPTCRDFINTLNEQNIKFCFVTNNSSRTTKEVYDVLTHMGYNIKLDNIITSSEVTAKYIKNEKPEARIYLLGMNGIKTELENNNLKVVEDNADYVVIGIDFNISFSKYANACKEIFNGAKFISTNSDLKLVTENGIVPGNGALTKVIEITTNIKPLYMGKPQPTMLEYGLKKLGLKKDEVALIGDNYYTDILGAYNFGIDSIFVETGIMTLEEMKTLPIKPTIMLKDLSQFKC